MSTQRRSYWLLDVTDLGADVRVNLRIRLFNSGDDRIFVTGIGLREFLHAGQSTQPVPVILEPHGTDSVTSEFTISQKEYGLGERETHPRLVLKVQTTDGKEVTMTIALSRRPL